MAASLDLGSFSNAEKTALLAAAKAELLRRNGIGSVQTGASAGQSFGMTKMTEDGLIRMINSLTVSLGYEDPIVQVRPNFANTAFTIPAASQ
jgi:hypothetical protein